MNIILSPVGMDQGVVYEKRGDVLVVNGVAFDFSRMKDGDTLPASAISSPMFTETVERIGSQLHMTLILPNPRNYSPEQAFPEPLYDVPDGVIQLPQPLPEPVEMPKPAPPVKVTP